MTRSPIRIAHLTDLHFCTSPASRYPAGPKVLRHAIDRLNGLELDAVLFTGDLFDDPRALERELPAFRAIMQGLRHPWYGAIGNHDIAGEDAAGRKRFLIESLGDAGLSATGRPYYDTALRAGVRLVVLDTTDNGEADYLSWRGFFSERQASWLDTVLTASRDEVVLIALHHPPVARFPLMDALKFNELDKRRLGRVLSAHSHVAALLCGHFHMAGWQPFGLSH
ncbi:MAG: metallophosphoesterase, partial [Cyanobacteria bacterium REEB65]|nr:metallophosphoesterase [Cyanobacteria bacterium REEB65]